MLLCALLQADSAWWDRDWAYRRPLEVRNHLEGPLPAGHPVSLRIQPEFLGLRGRARPDLGDLAVVHRGKRLPAARMAGPDGSSIVLWFPAGEAIDEDRTDGAYFIYYGNPEATSPAGSSAFGVFETFDGANAIPSFLKARPPLSAAVDAGTLRLRSRDPSRPMAAAGRVDFSLPPPRAGFALSVDLLVENAGAAMEVAAVVDLHAPGAGDPSVAPRVRKLLSSLSHPDWERRENATRELIEIGPAGAEELEKALASGDAEVRWRARHCLRMIREHHPPPVIRAGVRTGDPDASPVALPFAVGKLRGKTRHRPDGALRMRIDLQRDQDGDVMLTWNGSRLQTGHLPGAVKSVALTFVHGGGDPPPTVRIDALVLRACVDEESRPTTVLDPEEARP